MSAILGTIFDIKQMAVFDGPGIRTTVFFKGCPLRCKWCHNPEGLSFEPQLMVSDNNCLNCGKCMEKCSHKSAESESGLLKLTGGSVKQPAGCVACGECILACPNHLRRIAGTRMSVDELFGKLIKDKVIYDMNGGGVTLSGGEPTSQPEFVIEILKKLGEAGINRTIETCGYCRPDVFAKILDELDFIIMDLKLIDSEKHKLWTGRDNRMILDNLQQVKDSGKDYIIRVPLIPTVNDDYENKKATAELLKDNTKERGGHLVRVELMPYHQTAGAKYSMVNKEYDPGFDINTKPDTSTDVFAEYDIPVKVM